MAASKDKVLGVLGTLALAVVGGLITEAIKPGFLASIGIGSQKTAWMRNVGLVRETESAAEWKTGPNGPYTNRQRILDILSRLDLRSGQLKELRDGLVSDITSGPSHDGAPECVDFSPQMLAALDTLRREVRDTAIKYGAAGGAQ